MSKPLKGHYLFVTDLGEWKTLCGRNKDHVGGDVTCIPCLRKLDRLPVDNEEDNSDA